jgi:DNA-3-methyladenine glycosylase I
MVSVAFYSGFRAASVTAKMQEIEKIFSSYEKVAKFDEEKIQSIIDSRKVIGNRLKIQGIVYNAKQIKQIKKEFGSFITYLDSFGDRNDDDVLFDSVVPALKKRFKYLGKITVFHFFWN